MRLPLEDFKRRFPDRPNPPPLEYAGEWVAWDRTRTRIIAHGVDFCKVRSEAVAAGCNEPLMQKVLGTLFVGGT